MTPSLCGQKGRPTTSPPRRRAGPAAAVVLLAATVGAVGVVAGPLAGCASLQPRVADSQQRKPGHLALFLSLEDRDGEPVPGVPVSRFHLTEDGRPISAAEAKLRITNPTLPVAHYTMVLVDTSGSVSSTGQVPQVVAAARDFASRIAGDIHRVGVYRFDGAPKIEKIVDFGSMPQGAFGDAARFAPRDISTNLYGAIVEALEILGERRERGRTPLQFASLVVFTDGTDRARRLTRAAAQAAIQKTDIDVFVVAVPGEVDQEELRALAKNGLFWFPGEVGRLNATFDEMRRRIEARSRSYYLISYCSPARAGEHDLDILVDEGGRTGRVRHRFVADEFVPGCEPLEAPTFDWHPRYRHQVGDESERGSR